MALNLQTSPYYDDFDIEKNFHRILFKPGYAVQARELTQLQTILQNQIERFGNFVFKDGSVVLGCAETFQFSVPYVKIQDADQNGTDFTDSLFANYATSLLNGVVTNETGVSARIVLIDTDPNGQRVLYLNYLSAADDASGVSEFSAEDVLTIVDATGNTFSRKFVVLPAQINSVDTNFIGTGSLFTIGDGLVYAQGNFIRHLETTKVLDYFTSTPSKNVGFRVIQEAVTSDDDVTLLDPAAGSYNYAAPGADRYKLTTQVEVYAPLAISEANFYLLFVVEEGKVKRAFNKPQYAELQKTLAQRTFDESGNYSVTGLNVNIREHYKSITNNGKYADGSINKLVYGVEPGKAYVEGFDSELKATEYLTVDKATDTASHIEKLISTAFGNYVFVKSVQGDWSIGSDNLLVSLKNGGTTYATARVRLLKHYYGTPGNSSTTFYKLYLHSIVPSGSYTVADLVNVVTITDGGNNTCSVVITPGDSLLDVTQTAFKLHEAGTNSLIFPTTERAVVAFDDASTDYYYWKTWNVASINTTANISLTGNEQWLSVAGSLSDDDIKNYFYVVNDVTHAPVNFTSAAGDITLTSNSAALTLASGSANAHTIYGLVKISNVNPIAVTIERGWLKVDGSAVYSGNSSTNFAAGKIYLGTSNVYDIEAIYEKVIDAGGEDNPTVVFPSTEDFTSWTDVTNMFVLTKNDNDNFFDTAFITYTGTAITTKKFVIKYRYFRRATTIGYINKNSYLGCLIDADPTSPTTPPLGQDYKWIYTYQLPVYKSDISGITYDLRDVIDFRPYKVNRSTSDQINIAPVMGTTENVATSFQTGIIVPDPDRELTATFTYNLPRIDKVLLTRDGEFKVLQGISSLKPQAPNDESHAMTLAQVHLSPYPSLSTYVAKQVGREDYASFVRLTDNRRYTMKDIGNLEHRINRLEYFTALSIMENKVANMVILEDPNDLTSNVLAKKGILVDSFDGHGVGNVFDVDYNAAIDAKKKQLRPAITLENIEFEVVGSSNKKGDAILTGASHTHSEFISNNFASKSRVCGNRILGNFKNGQITLDPPQDMWMDVNVRPDVQANYQGNNDGWEYDNTPFNIHWNGWQTIWQGVEITSLNPVDVSIVNGITGVRSYNESAQLVSDITRSMITAANVPESNIRSIGVRVLDISIIPFIRSHVVTFIASGLLPNSIVKAYFDNEDVSDYCRYFTGVTPEMAKTYVNPVLVGENTPSEYGADLLVGADGTIVGQFRIPENTFRSGSRVFRLESSSGATSAATQYYSLGVATVNEGGINSTRFAGIRQDALTTVQNAVVERLTQSNPSSFNPSSYGDPMAQTFIIEGETDGVMVTKVDLYFRTKSETQGVAVQIREVVNGNPGNKIVPFSTKLLKSVDVNVSTNATTATTFEFESPVYLKNNVEYALMILPENNNTDYEIWVSELGQNKLGTTERITQQPYIGVLFVPNNNTSWTALEAEDLKFTLYKGVFSTAETTVQLQSAPIDYIVFSQTGAHQLIPGDTVDTGSYVGYVMEVFEDTAKIYVSSGVLSISDTFTIDTSTFTIDSIVDKDITAIAPNFGTLTIAPTTNIDLKYQLMNSAGNRETGYTILKNGDTLELNSSFKLFSHSNRANCIYMQASLTTSNTAISPVLDVRKLSMLTVANDVSNSAYITRTVTLDGTADDLRVFLDVLMPEGCDVIVKAKMLPAGSDTPFADLSWITLMTHAPATVNRLDFREYYYMVPTPFEYSKFAVKVEMTTPDSSKVPLIKNFRAVALV